MIRSEKPDSGPAPQQARSASRILARRLAPVLLAGLVLAQGLLATPTAGQDGAARRVEVYPARHRRAEELLPIAETAMAGEGSATLDPATSSLVLVGEPAAVAEALRLLASLDRRPRTIVLRYDDRRVRDLEAQGFDVRWTARAGDLRIGNVRWVGHSDAKGKVEVRADDAMRALSESFSATMRVVEGARTRIETGTSMPYATSPSTSTSKRGPHPAARRAAPTIAYATATTGFEARARVLGDGRIEVDLSAFAGRFLRQDAIDTLNANTRVALQPGETVAVAGVGQARDEQRRELLSGAGSGSQRDETVLLLRADLE